MPDTEEVLNIYLSDPSLEKCLQSQISIQVSFLKIISFVTFSVTFFFFSQGPGFFFPDQETSVKVSPGESHKRSENQACLQRGWWVLSQAWAPGATLTWPHPSRLPVAL